MSPGKLIEGRSVKRRGTIREEAHGLIFSTTRHELRTPREDSVALATRLGKVVEVFAIASSVELRHAGRDRDARQVRHRHASDLALEALAEGARVFRIGRWQYREKPLGVEANGKVVSAKRGAQHPGHAADELLSGRTVMLFEVVQLEERHAEGVPRAERARDLASQRLSGTHSIHEARPGIDAHQFLPHHLAVDLDREVVQLIDTLVAQADLALLSLPP